MTEVYGPPNFTDWVDSAWREGIGVWGVSIELTPPLAWDPKDKDAFGGSEPLAFVNMETRQVVVNYSLLHEMNALHCLPAVLAHEVGHHIRFPHTLGLAARLELLMARILPGAPRMLLNLFFDLQVNEYVGHTHAASLQEVYRAFSRRAATDSPIFAFYLAIYEELWGLPPGDLGKHAPSLTMDATYPNWEIEARMFAQTFWSLPDSTLQFIYFCSIIARYLTGHEGKQGKMPMSGDLIRPTPDDYANALGGSRAVDNAIDEATKKGWLDAAKSGEIKSKDALAGLDRVLSGMPGNQAAPFRRAIVNKHYYRLVEEHLFRVPPKPNQRPPDAIIPSTTEDREWGDSPSAIDWTASIRAAGAMAAAMPLQRTLLPDESDKKGHWMPHIEIWLDTSGSMPDPQTSVNAMTLAAQILAAAAIRKGGRVRAVIYSWGDPLISDWMQDEAKARDFLLNYSGGGTDYPFTLFKEHSLERKDTIHVVISDSDYLYNTKENKNYHWFMDALDRTEMYIALLQSADGYTQTALKKALEHPKFRLILVPNFTAFAKTASDLADTLFGVRR